ncbi:MAG: hypothetical protein GDA52_03000 [Rhodobacteraceae bacterium]|nr:hypothetical protein [Paracoccaceae bacterium]
MPIIKCAKTHNGEKVIADKYYAPVGDDAPVGYRLIGGRGDDTLIGEYSNDVLIGDTVRLCNERQGGC